MSKTTVIAALLSFVFALACPARGQEEGPGKQELSGAEHFLKLFEQRVERAKGAPFKLRHDGTEALKRIRSLKERFPNDPRVDELFERAKAALIASKGETVTITPEMLAYRENEKKLVQIFLAEAEKQWKDYLSKVEAAGDILPKPFPSPSIREVSVADMVGKVVVLDEFEYPTNQFYDLGREFVHVGAGVRGYYFVDIGNREWLGIYEAVKRYRRLINSGLPEGGKWTLVGRIVGLELLVPSAGKEQVGPAHWGWRVLPEAVYVPDSTFAVVEGDNELGGRFAGEERLEEIKAPLYTVRSIPDDVSPERLVEIFATAIKEKNYELFLECIDPMRKKTKTALSRVRYHWDRHQERFRRFYCHITPVPEKTEISAIRGFDEEADDEGFFLDEKEREKIRERSDPLEEEAVVWTKAWNERGLQYGSEKPHLLRRYQKKRWFIHNYSDQY